MVSHLLFADMLVYSKGDVKSAYSLSNTLRKLELYYQQAEKQSFFRKGCKNKDELATILSVPISCLPIKYLCLLLTSFYPKARQFSPLIDRVKGIIEGWQLGHRLWLGELNLLNVFYIIWLAIGLSLSSCLVLCVRSLKGFSPTLSRTIRCMRGIGKKRVGLTMREVVGSEDYWILIGFMSKACMCWPKSLSL